MYITPSTEAWGMLFIMNCRERWPMLMAEKEKSSARITYVKSDKGATKSGTKYINLSSNPGFLGKYTKTDSGQKQFGGWSQEGLLLYTKLVQENKKARAKPETVALEQAILDKLRVDNEISGANWAEHKKAAAGDTDGTADAGEVEGLFDMDDVGEMEAI